MKTLRIFISSPSDVRAERVRAYDVVQQLQTKFRAFIKIETILWEHEPLRATASFQAQIPKPSESDVVVSVLWAKIGTRLPQDFKRADGTVPTGTEWEFEDAYEAFKTRGTPDLLVYRKLAPPQITVTSDEMLEEWQRQKRALDVFLNRWFRDHEGAFKAAFHAFETDEEFEKLLTAHLDKIINEKLESKAPITWTEGSPFRGLDVFGFEHQKIFFGRDLAIAEISRRLTEQASRGRVFLLLLGMSGCGKSSLVRAGVLPEIMRPGVVKNVACWRSAVLRPSAARGDLTDALASALLGEKSALPELAQLGYDASRLAALIREAPAHAIPLIEAALKNAAECFAKENLRSQAAEARLLLVIDQMEEMFTIERFDVAQRVAFVRAVSALSRSGLVWVIATMRSDLYARVAELEDLQALKGEDGQYDVSPPGIAEIGQIIRLPALAAGLEFESHPVTHQKLDAVLQEQASKNPEALPLLEFCLDELYKLRTESRLITWEAYEKLGGLQGAIAERAEEVYKSLSPAAQEAFSRVLSALVTMDAVASSRPAPRRQFAENAGAEELVAAFARANLFVTHIDQAGDPIVSVAHEALIASWPRVQNWVQENKDFLRLKTRIAQAAHRWRESGRHEDFLLPEGKPLAEAADALEKHRAKLEETEFVEASLRRAARRTRTRRLQAAAVLTLVLSLIFGSVVAYQVRKRSDALAAEASARLAASETDVVFAAEEMARNEPSISLAFLADAMRKNPRNQKAMALAVAELRDMPMPLVILHHDGEVQDASFSPDGGRVVTASADGTARLWNAKTGQPIGLPMRHNDWVHTAEFSPDGNTILTASWDGRARLWNAWTGAPIGKPMVHDRNVQYGRVNSAHFSPDGKYIVTASWDHTARIWDARNPDHPEIGPPLRCDAAVWAASFSPILAPVETIVTASADHTARLWNAETGAEELSKTHNDEVNDAVFSPDGKWVATASDDGTGLILNAHTFQVVGRIQHDHGRPVNFVSFSPNSQLVVTASSDDTARIWQVPSGKEVGLPLRHSGWVRSAVFSADSRWVVTASYDRTARVWDANTGLPVTPPMQHGGAVYMARFDPKDSSLVITASLDHTARIWKWSVPKTHPAMSGSGVLRTACLDADASRLVTVSDTGEQIWNPHTGQRVGAPRPLGAVQVAVCSSDGHLLFTASANQGQIWDAQTGTRVGATIPLAQSIETASFDRQDRRLVTVAESGFQFWDARTGHPASAPIRFGTDVKGAVFSSDGRMLATYTHGGRVDVWSVPSGAPLSKTMLDEGEVTSVAFSPDGKLLASSSSTEHAVRIWNIPTGTALSTLHFDSWVRDADFSPDGRWIVAATAGATAQVWDPRTASPVSQLMRHQDAVLLASFSPDGQWVVTASQDGLARVWDARTGVPVANPMVHVNAVPLGRANPVRAGFSADRKWILTAWQDVKEDGTPVGWEARLWEAPLVAPTAPDWLIRLAELVGGERLDSHGVLQPTTQNENFAALRQQLGRLAGNDPLSRFGRWLVADPQTRPLSPMEMPAVGLGPKQGSQN